MYRKFVSNICKLLFFSWLQVDAIPTGIKMVTITKPCFLYRQYEDFRSVASICLSFEFLCCVNVCTFNVAMNCVLLGLEVWGSSYSFQYYVLLPQNSNDQMCLSSSELRPKVVRSPVCVSIRVSSVDFSCRTLVWDE